MPKHPDQVYWDSLPIKKARVGDGIRTIKYDPKTMTAYMLDSKGEWTGEQATLEKQQVKPGDTPEKQVGDKAAEQQPQAKPLELPTEPEVPAPEPQSARPQAAQNTVEKPVAAQGDVPPVTVQTNTTAKAPAPAHAEKKDPKKEKGKKKAPIGLLLILSLLVFIVIAPLILASKSSQNGQEVLPENTEGEISTVSTEPSIENASLPTNPQGEDTEAKKIYLLSSPVALIPGDVITAETFEQTEVTEFEYRQLSVVEGLFTADDLTAMIGLEIIEYIPAGNYVSYSKVGSYTPTNPWLTEGPAYVTIPVAPNQDDLLFYSWGTAVDISVSVRTKQNTDTTEPAEESTTPAGVEHEGSVLEQMMLDTYKIQNVPVKDVLGADGNSLFNRYSAISEIPTVFQTDYMEQIYADSAVLAADLPAHLVLCVTGEQAELLNSLPQEDVTVTVTASRQLEQTALQMDTYNALQQVLKNIAQFLAETTGGQEDA